MRRFLSLLAWIGLLLAGALCFITVPTLQSNRDEAGMITNCVIGALLLLLSGIARRAFGIKKHVVESRGLWPAILSRINCARFYWSIFYYGAMAVMVFFLSRQEGDGDMVKGLIALAVTGFLFVVMRYTCPRCGVGLRHDGDTLSEDGELEFYSDQAIESHEKTSYYHCPRCGRKVRMKSKQATRVYKY